MALLEKLEILIGEMKAGKFDYSRQANEQCPQEQTDESYLWICESGNLGDSLFNCIPPEAGR
jgi:hypothetical protein